MSTAKEKNAKIAAAAEKQKNAELLAERNGEAAPKPTPIAISQKISHGEEVILAHLPPGLVAGDNVQIPVHGGGFLVAVVPDEGSDAWLEDRCIEFLVPPHEDDGDDDEEEEEEELPKEGDGGAEAGALSAEEEAEKQKALYKRRQNKGLVSTTVDEELENSNFSKPTKAAMASKYAHKPTKADHLKEGKDEYGKMGRRSRRSTVSIHHPSSIIAHHPDPLSHNPFPSPTSLLSHTTAKRKKGANGRVATTQGQTPQITERRTTSEPSMDLQVQTLSEVEEKQWRHGRKHTHDALTTAKSDYASRAGEDGTVGATQIDERLQTAHFAQPVGKPRPKFLTVRRKYTCMHHKICCYIPSCQPSSRSTARQP